MELLGLWRARRGAVVWLIAGVVVEQGAGFFKAFQEDGEEERFP